MASESRRHSIAGVSETEVVSDNVAVGSIVHEPDSEVVLLADSEKDSLSLATRESDRYSVKETVRVRLDVAVKENVPVSVALSVASRLAVSDKTTVWVNVLLTECVLPERDSVLPEWDSVRVVDRVDDDVGVEGTVDDGEAERVTVSEGEGLVEALNVGGGEMVKEVVGLVVCVWLGVGIVVAVTDADGDVDGDNVTADKVTERLNDADAVPLEVGEGLVDRVMVDDKESVWDRVMEIVGVGGEDLVSEGEMVSEELEVGLVLVDGVPGRDAVDDAVALGVGVTLAVGGVDMVVVGVTLDVDDSDADMVGSPLSEADAVNSLVKE